MARSGYVEVDYDAELKKEVGLLIGYGKTLSAMMNKAAESCKPRLEKELDALCAQISDYGAMSKDDALSQIMRDELSGRGEAD